MYDDAKWSKSQSHGLCYTVLACATVKWPMTDKWSSITQVRGLCRSQTANDIVTWPTAEFYDAVTRYVTQSNGL